MMKKRNKVLALMVLSCIIVSMFAGCSKKETVKTDVSKTTETPSSSTETGLTGSLASKDPIELSIHMHYWDSIVYNDEWPVFQKAAELTNVALKGVASATATDSVSVFNLMMSSGDLPDLVHGTMNVLQKYASDGAFLPLNDLIEKHAPDLNAFLDANPDIRKGLTQADGNIYYIPYIEDNPTGKLWFIRQDWLDKFDLKAPTTKDEYYNVLKTFVEQDANGNGKKDEVGFFNRDSGAGTSELLPLFNVPMNWMLEDGKVIHGFNHPGLKDAMIEIAQWYEEGLIDKEIFTRGNNARDVMFGENIGASTHDWPPSTANYNNSVKENIPEFNLTVIAPPNAQTGRAWDYSPSSGIGPGGQAIAISAQTKYAEEAIRYLNFWWTQEGRKLANYGFEGEQYEIVDSKIVYLESFLTTNPDTALIEKLKAIGAQTAFAYHMDYNYVMQTMHPAAIEGLTLYKENEYSNKPFPMLTFTEEEQGVINTKMTTIDTFYKEQTQKWVLGAEDPAKTYDSYISKMKDIGLDEVIAIYQAAYDRFNK